MRLFFRVDIAMDKDMATISDSFLSRADVESIQELLAESGYLPLTNKIKRLFDTAESLYAQESDRLERITQARQRLLEAGYLPRTKSEEIVTMVLEKLA